MLAEASRVSRYTVAMRVAAYVHIRRTRLDLGQTGVGKHISEVVRGLAQHPGVELQILGAREDLVNGQLPPASTLQGLPVKTFGLPRRYLELAWATLRWPKVESWTGPVEWVYCPAEAYVARRRAKLAVAIHSVYWFEKDTAWNLHPTFRSQRRRWARRFRRFRDSTDLLLPVSQFLADRLTALFGIPPERMRVVGNGVEEAYYHAGELDESWRRRIGDRRYVLAVGGLTAHRGADCLLAVAGELHRRKSDLQILIAGVGEPRFSEAAAQLPNVVQLGYVGVDSGLPALMRNSTALLFPSHYETFGIPAAEAMAAGTPAVVAHFAALPEVVDEAGILIEPSQPAAIADTLENLARDAKLRAKYVEAGRRRAEEFHWQRCVERTFNALREFSNQ
ncbi:MAG: glycosyltransferase family 4 protein [Gemmataceae bacterium]